jgi:hypothetical protein
VFSRQQPEPQPGEGVAYGPDGIYTVWMKVTPEQAYEWQLNQAPNRGLSKAHAQPMIDDILADRFYAIPGGVAFRRGDDKMIDGQHTTYAIFETGKEVWLQATYNLPPEAQKAIDSNRIRRFADDAKIAGIPQPVQVAAAFRLVFAVEDGWERGWSIKGLSSKKYSRLDMDDRFYNDIKKTLDSEEAIKMGEHAYRHQGLVQSAGTALYALVARHGAGEKYGRRFLESFGNQYGVYPGDPEIALKKRVEKLREQESTPDNAIFLAYAMKAYNAWARNQEMHIVNFRSGEEILPPYKGFRREEEIPDIVRDR